MRELLTYVSRWYPANGGHYRSHCRLGLLSSVLPTSQSNGSKAVYMGGSPSSEDLTIEVQSTSCRKFLCCPQVHPRKRVTEDGDWSSWSDAL